MQTGQNTQQIVNVQMEVLFISDIAVTHTENQLGNKVHP